MALLPGGAGAQQYAPPCVASGLPGNMAQRISDEEVAPRLRRSGFRFPVGLHGGFGVPRDVVGNTQSRSGATRRQVGSATLRSPDSCGTDSANAAHCPRTKPRGRFPAPAVAAAAGACAARVPRGPVPCGRRRCRPPPARWCGVWRWHDTRRHNERPGGLAPRRVRWNPSRAVDQSTGHFG